MKWFRFLLLFTLLAPPPSAPLKAAVPQDCAICGHACCCPEMCKPLIEKAKTSCHNETAACQMDRKEDAAQLALMETSSKAVPFRWNWTDLNLALQDPFLIYAAPQPILSSYLLQDVPTPPPKRLA
jgi:hypothetical protein